ncbi:replication-relaxation family protein [Streptomyces sp. NPDC060028]|uniref:replication-relaxation family protein n=1 Tax=Streptomyces sp. NPDC060028 TaxID=3347041 RepID=UPI0036A0E084
MTTPPADPRIEVVAARLKEAAQERADAYGPPPAWEPIWKRPRCGCATVGRIVVWRAGLVGRPHRAQHSYWCCTPAGLAEAAASGELAPRSGRSTGKRAASKTGLREHGLALDDTVIAFHQAEAADFADWQGEVAHPTPAGNLVPEAVVLLNNGPSEFVEIDRTMSYARLVAKLERYDAYRNAPASGRGNAARAPRSPWQETYAGPSLERSFLGGYTSLPPPRGSGSGGRFPQPCPRRRQCELPADRSDHDAGPADAGWARPAGVAGRRP